MTSLCNVLAIMKLSQFPVAAVETSKKAAPEGAKDGTIAGLLADEAVELDPRRETEMLLF